MFTQNQIKNKQDDILTQDTLKYDEAETQSKQASYDNIFTEIAVIEEDTVVSAQLDIHDFALETISIKATPRSVIFYFRNQDGKKFIRIVSLPEIVNPEYADAEVVDQAIKVTVPKIAPSVDVNIRI